MSVDSPCNRICTLDAHDICLGCGRHLDEITGWLAMNDAARAVVVARAAERLRLARRRG